MKISYKNPIRKFYNHTFGHPIDHSPTNFCDLFWGVLLGIIMFPFLWFGYLLGWRTKPRTFWEKFIYTLIANLGLATILLALMGNEAAIEFITILVFVVIVVSLVLGTIYFLSETKAGGSVSKGLSRTGSAVKTGFLSIKDKFCPIIEWDNKD